MMPSNNYNKKLISTGLVIFLIIVLDFCSNRPAALFKNALTFGPAVEISSAGETKPRRFPGPRRLSSEIQPPLIAKTRLQNSSFPRLTADCDNWVLTSSNHTSYTDIAVRSLNGGRRISPAWCIVIVGDEFDDVEGNISQNDNVIFLSAKQQADINHPFVHHVLSSLHRQPNNPFIRRNIGYLFAIKHGAKVVHDAYTSDFNCEIDLFSPPGAFRFFHGRTRVLVKYLENFQMPPSSFMFHPLSPMLLKTTKSKKKKSNKKRWRYGSIDYAALGMAFPLDVNHQQCSSPNCGTRFLAPIQNYALSTFNSVTFFQQAFWGLLLPTTVQLVFRSLFAQKFLHELNLGLVFEETSTGQECHSVRKTEFSTDLVEFLASKEAFSYPGEEVNTNLPARIEFFIIELFEHGHVGIDDVYNVQEWLLALIDIGYKFPAVATTTVAAHSEIAVLNSSPVPTLAVLHEPSMEGQAYLATPAFNVDLSGHRYKEFWEESENEDSMALFNEWLRSPKLFQRPANDQAILKIIVMTKDEGSLLQDWVTYHGELIGYENLYVIDGSTDTDSIKFLTHARKHWGVNVIFSSQGLDHLRRTLSRIARAVSKASDFVVKVDTDEFLVARNGNSTCIQATHLPPVADDIARSDCTLSPYVVRNVLDQLPSIATGERLRVGYLALSHASAEVCKNDCTKNDIGSFPLSDVVEAGWYKAISDARTLAGVDLGGHDNSFVPPFGDTLGLATDLGIMHFHFRCFETEVANCRKAVVSHQFIDESDSDETAIEKLFEIQEEWGNPLQRDTFCEVTELRGHSCHKVLFYLRYLLGCISAENFYPSAAGTKQNPDFVSFLNAARMNQGIL